MVKSVLSVAQRGLRDWIVQRVSAIVMALLSIVFAAYLVTRTSDYSYAEWHTLFTYTPVKIATLFFLLAMCFHAWIGLWSVFTDYVKHFALRAFLHLLVLATLIACFIWGVMIMWSV